MKANKVVLAGQSDFVFEGKGYEVDLESGEVWEIEGSKRYSILTHAACLLLPAAPHTPEAHNRTPAARILVQAPASTMVPAMRSRTLACMLSDVVDESFATIDCGAAMSMASPNHPGVAHGKLRPGNYRIQAALGNLSGATQHGMMVLDVTKKDGQDHCIQGID